MAPVWLREVVPSAFPALPDGVERPDRPVVLPPGVAGVDCDHNQMILTVRFCSDVAELAIPVPEAGYVEHFPYSALAATPEHSLEAFLLREVSAYRRWRGFDVEFAEVYTLGSMVPQRIPVGIRPSPVSPPSTAQAAWRSDRLSNSFFGLCALLERDVLHVDDVSRRAGTEGPTFTAPPTPPCPIRAVVGPPSDPWPAPAPGPRRIRLEEEPARTEESR